jgi:predicted DNA-binding transcriptional regulator AlpA
MNEVTGAEGGRRLMPDVTKIVVLSEAELEQLIERAVIRALNGNASNQKDADRLLTPSEAASLLNVSPRWLYRHAKNLPFTRRLSPKALRFSEAGLLRYRATKKS